MAYPEKGFVAQELGTLFEGGTVAGLTDRQLLERFNSGRDAAGEAAFAALVSRHGPMVLSVSRQILRDYHFAEEAFQATFLVLARKARSIRDSDRLGNWLYGVALRTARCARLRRSRRRERDELVSTIRSDSTVLVDSAVPPAEAAIMAREQLDVLHCEIARLPDAFRLPIVLCYLEGLTVHEAAGQLQWSHGTLRSRMARARKKLRRGLARRGIVLPAAALAALLDTRPASASIPSLLAEITTRAALRFVAGPAAVDALSATTRALAQEVLRSMLFHKLKLAALVALLLGAGILARSLAIEEEPGITPAVQQPRTEKGPDETKRGQDPGPGRMFVSGHVLDPAGKFAPGVAVDVIGRPRAPWVGTEEYKDRRILVGRGETDAQGHFRIDALRTSAYGFFEVYALAAAPGCGLGWVELNADAKEPAAEIRLRPERVIHGKLIDVQGQPAAGVELQVWSVGRSNVPGAKGGYDGVSMGNPPPPDGLRVWPRPGVTDAVGRFELAGIGRDVTVGFQVRDQRFARGGFRVRVDEGDGPKTVTETLRPAMVIAGRVMAADTGQPIPQTLVELGLSGGSAEARARADDQGRFSATVQPAKNYSVRAFPPVGQPYLIDQVEFEWSKGAVRKDVDIKVPRGAVIRGKVVEERTGRALPGASVQYLPFGGNGGGLASGSDTTVVSEKDGSYQIAVRPGKGHLFVFGPTPDYVLQAIGGRTIFNGEPGGERRYAHGIIPYEIKAGDEPLDLTAVLHPGRTIKGRVVGPKDEMVKHAMIISTLHIEHFHLRWRGDLALHARDGLFELRGLDPEKPIRVSFLDADHEWGTTVEVSAKQAGKDLVVRLQRCGRANARIVGPDGKPLAKVFPLFEILGTPGPHAQDRRKEARSLLSADAAYLSGVDGQHYWKDPVSDAEGRITLPDLIPGALYRISDLSTVSDREKGVQVRKEFTVQPDETVDLDDILIEKPKSYGR